MAEKVNTGPQPNTSAADAIQQGMRERAKDQLERAKAKGEDQLNSSAYANGTPADKAAIEQNVNASVTRAAGNFNASIATNSATQTKLDQLNNERSDAFKRNTEVYTNPASSQTDKDKASSDLVSANKTYGDTRKLADNNGGALPGSKPDDPGTDLAPAPPPTSAPPSPPPDTSTNVPPAAPTSPTDTASYSGDTPVAPPSTSDSPAPNNAASDSPRSNTVSDSAASNSTPRSNTVSDSAASSPNPTNPSDLSNPSQPNSITPSDSSNPNNSSIPNSITPSDSSNPANSSIPDSSTGDSGGSNGGSNGGNSGGDNGGDNGGSSGGGGGGGGGGDGGDGGGGGDGGDGGDSSPPATVPNPAQNTPIVKVPDQRVRLTPKDMKLLSGTFLAPLGLTMGFMFPYTPTIRYEGTVTYGSQTLVHSNQNFKSYTATEATTLTISGKFTSQTQAEAQYTMACLHFLRSFTKMRFGQGSGVGLPPPVLVLNGYGIAMFNNLSVIITNFSMELPDNVDYVKTTVAGLDAWVPAFTTITLTCVVQNTPNKLRTFNWDEFASGALLNKGGWS